MRREWELGNDPIPSITDLLEKKGVKVIKADLPERFDGLGETIYGAIRTLDIATSINASIAIVVLTMVLDRVTQSLARTK